MENRLCQYTESFSPREAGDRQPRSSERPNKRPELRKLGDEVLSQAKIDAIRASLDPSKLTDVIEDNYGEALPTRLRDISALYGPQLRGPDGIEQRLLKDLRLTGTVREQIRLIVDAVARPLPAHAARGRMDHRYVRMSAGDGRDKKDWYGINFKQIDTDRKMISDMRTVNSQSAAPNGQLEADLGALDFILSEFAKQDHQLSVHIGHTTPTHMNDTFKELGRMSVVLVAGGMTLLTGFIGIFNLKSKGITAMSSALLYGMVTLAAAKPDMIRRWIGPGHEAYVQDLHMAMDGKGLESASIEYGVMGPAWKNLVRRIMSNDSTTTTFLAEKRSFGTNPERDEKTIERYVQSMMPEGGTARADLKRMIVAGDFDAFVRRLTSISDNDAKATVIDLVGKGTLQYGRVARVDAQHAQEELERVEQSMPAAEQPAQ